MCPRVNIGFTCVIDMKKFSDHLAGLPNADHVQRIILTNRDGSTAGQIENKPGSQGSIKVYHYLLQKWGGISVEAAREGLVIYAEHAEDAQLNPGKHPNIDRLFDAVANDNPLGAEIERVS